MPSRPTRTTTESFSPPDSPLPSFPTDRPRLRRPRWPPVEALRAAAGQATAEYALVLLAAAALAGLALAWATGTDAISRLMDAVLDSLISDVR